MGKIPFVFNVSQIGDFEKFSDTISRGRVRIFYKYENRNGSYITDEFAETLLSSLPYTPVKGIYDVEGEDYTDHGGSREEGRIYGIVPEDPNVTWEKHLDEDGVEREYACADVLFFTALYKEAENIFEKGQSMELYPPSIEGEWVVIDGRRMYKFTAGCFLGLQVLGDNTEPCFEGAAFFSLFASLKDLLKQLESYGLIQKNNQGGTEVMRINFKMSDREKFDKIWDALNPKYNEENGWIVEYSIDEVYDDYALVRNYDEQKYERVYYTKTEDDEVVIEKRVDAYVIDVTEEEYNALKALWEKNGNTYTAVDTLNDQIFSLEEEKTQSEQKITELEDTVSTLEQEKENAVSENSTLNETVQNLEGELNSLKEYKAAIEDTEKEGVINTYANLLSEEVITSYREQKDEFTAIDLDKELAYELKKNNPNIFKLDPQIGLLPKDEPESGIEEILAKYNK